MRKENKLFFKKEKLALLNDCIYYCRQNKQITNEESNKLENFLETIDKIIKKL